MFQLEKSTDTETFAIRGDSPWVTLDENGDVRVKRRWDYEELGPEKTIDFWVIITNSGLQNEQSRFPHDLHHHRRRIYSGGPIFEVISLISPPDWDKLISSGLTREIGKDSAE